MKIPPLAKDIMTVTIDDISSSGEGVGRLDNGKVVFVLGGCPSDVLDVHVVEETKSFVRAHLISIQNPGKDRVKPICALAESFDCGGCSLMHVGKETQKKAKENFVKRAFRHMDVIIHPIVTPVPEIGYRIRARFIKRGAVLGFQAARSHRVTAVDTCKVLVPALEEAMTQMAKRLQPYVGEEGTFAGVIGAESQIHVAVSLGDGGNKEAASSLLLEEISMGSIVGACIDEDVLGQKTVNVGSKESPLFVSADAFAQASEPGHSLLPMLTKKSVAGIDPLPISSILELHAGRGNFSRFLVSLTKRLVCVEMDVRSADVLRQTLLGDVQVLALSDKQAVASLIHKGQTFEVIVLDPPRTGAKEIMDQLPKLMPRRIVYVSCDPMTLARDTTILQKHGFFVKEITPIDLMPQTSHVEMVCVLEKK